MNELGITEPHDLSGYSRTPFKKNADCPICGCETSYTTSTETLHIVGMRDVETAYGYCGYCGHMYQVLPPSEAVLQEYYTKFSNYISKPPTSMSLRLLRLARQTCGGSIYEVGCATGKHLAFFRMAGGWTVDGCDPSPEACRAAREEFNLKIDCGTEAECLPKQKDLDVVMYSGVLEHLLDPVASLRRAHTALQPNGRVLIEVPCATAPETLPPGYLAFEHLHYYTVDSMRNLLGIVGFKMIEARVNYDSFIYPVLTVLAEKTEEVMLLSKTPSQSGDFLANLARRDMSFWLHSRKKLEAIPGPLIIWGAGIHTSQLLDRIPELLDRVEFFIDSDPQKQGQYLASKPIASPADGWSSKNPPTRVVISSYYKEKEILRQCPGAVTLYD